MGKEKFPEVKMKEKPSFEVGQDAMVLTGKRWPIKERIVTIQKIFIGPDGKTWIRAWWPGQDTDPELKTNEMLRQNGITVDDNNHIVEGPADKFR